MVALLLIITTTCKKKTTTCNFSIKVIAPEFRIPKESTKVKTKRTYVLLEEAAYSVPSKNSAE
jgi:hypothetical protein